MEEPLKPSSKIQEFRERLLSAKAWMPDLSPAAAGRIEEQRRHFVHVIDDTTKKSRDPKLRLDAEKRAAISLLKAMEREYRPLVGDYYPRTVQILGNTAVRTFGAGGEVDTEIICAVDAEVAWSIVHHLNAKLNGASDIEVRSKIRTAWLKQVMSMKPGMTITNIQAKFRGPTHQTLNKWRGGHSNRTTNSLREKLSQLFSCPISDVPL